MTKLSKLECVAEGLQIFLKYSKEYDVFADYEILSVITGDDEIREEDEKRLHELSFYSEDGSGEWVIYV
jgi:hypothetical protein